MRKEEAGDHRMKVPSQSPDSKAKMLEKGRQSKRVLVCVCVFLGRLQCNYSEISASAF